MFDFWNRLLQAGCKECAGGKKRLRNKHLSNSDMEMQFSSRRFFINDSRAGPSTARQRFHLRQCNIRYGTSGLRRPMADLVNRLGPAPTHYQSIMEIILRAVNDYIINLTQL